MKVIACTLQRDPVTEFELTRRLRAAQHATRTLPIVFTAVSEPLAPIVDPNLPADPSSPVA
jgi:hypothetical protein